MRTRHRLICVLLIPSVMLIGCNTTSAPEQRARLHGSPLSQDEVVELAASPGHPEQVAIEARLRGLGFDLDDETRAGLAARGVQPRQIERLDLLSRETDPLGGQANPRNTPLVVAGVVLGAAAVTGLVWLCVELFDDADHKAIIVHDGSTYVRVED